LFTRGGGDARGWPGDVALAHCYGLADWRVRRFRYVLTNGCTDSICFGMGRGAVGFEWDKGNRDKCQKHGVPIATIESLFHGPLAVVPDPEHSDTEERLKAIGRTDDGRGVLIVFTLRRLGDEIFIRPVSARYMHRTEVEYYEKAIAKTDQRRGG
jgi:uncharacterized DUF497 family protein